MKNIIIMSSDIIALPLINFLLKDCKSYIKIIAIYSSNIDIIRLSKTNNILSKNPKNLNDIELDFLKKHNIDIILVCGYGKILNQTFLLIPKYGCFNIHASLLPKYRGPSPIESAILSGESKTGVTLIKMNEYIDQGLIVSQKSINIHNTDTKENIKIKISNLIVFLIKKFLINILNDNIKYITQNNNLASYTRKIIHNDAFLDFNLNGKKILNKIKAFYPYPGSCFKFKKELIYIHDCHLIYDNFFSSQFIAPGQIFGLYNNSFVILLNKNEQLFINQMKRQNKKWISAKDFINGFCLPKNYILESFSNPNPFVFYL